jgi:hypothetical protein
VSVRLVTRKMLDEGLGQDSWLGAFVVALAGRLALADARPDMVSRSGGEKGIREGRRSSFQRAYSSTSRMSASSSRR